jgi:hypothetical protein
MNTRHAITATFVIVITIFASDSMGAQEQKAPGKKISYRDYIGTITQKLPELRRNEIQVERAKNTLYGTESTEDTFLEGDATYTKSKQYSMNPYSRTGYTSEYTANLGIARKFNRTGTTVNAGVSYYEFRNDINYEGVSLPNTYYYPSAYIKFSQSILKNTFGVIDRFAKNDAVMKLEIEKLRRGEADKSDLNYYRKLYFNWIEYLEQIKLINESIENARALSNQVARRFRTGLADNDDVQSAAALVLQYQATYEEVKAALVALERELKLFLDTTQYQPDESEFGRLYAMTREKDYSRIPFEKTRSAEIYRITKKNLHYARDIAENRLLPQLDLVAQYTRKSQDDQFSTAAHELNDTDYYIGFSMSYPLENIESRSGVREVKLSIQEINNEFDVSKNDYHKSLDSLIEYSSGTNRVIDLKERRIKTLESKYRTELKKYQQTRLDLQFLINTANEITSERIGLLQLKNRMIQYAIDYDDLTK